MLLLQELKLAVDTNWKGYQGENKGAGEGEIPKLAESRRFYVKPPPFLAGLALTMTPY